MKVINKEQLIEDVQRACIEANIYLNEDVKEKLTSISQSETNPIAKSIYHQISENIDVAKDTGIPLCQDTGIVVFHITLGNKVKLDFDLYEALNEAVRLGYTNGHLRKSIVSDPLNRVNTNDNTPAVFHVELENSDKFEIIIAPKGAGSENMSSFKAFTPQTSKAEIEDYIVSVIESSGGKACPPLVVGVGIGGTFEKSALMAKRALMYPIGRKNPNPFYEHMENELISKINKLDIGAMGLGGKQTCLDVNIEYYPSHIASLMVSVNLNCHVARHKVVSY